LTVKSRHLGDPRLYLQTFRRLLVIAALPPRLSRRRAGIGFGIVRRLIAEGATVYAQGWTPQDATQPWGWDSEGASAVRPRDDRVRTPKLPAEERHASLIVLGSPRRHGILGHLVSSVTAAVIDHSALSVLVTHQQPEPRDD
jgi:hypothetical protein